MKVRLLLFLFVFFVWQSWCPGFAASPIQVVTTVAPLTDLVRQVGRDTIRLHGLVPEGVNSHTFQPAPTDVKYIAQADLIILNGLNLEVPIEKLTQSSGKAGATLLKLGNNTITSAEWVFDFSFPKEHGDPNPHLWLNVVYTMKYVELIRDQLIALDPDHKEVYQQNAAQYLAHLSQLDQAIAQAVATIPPDQRKLLTYHDSWPYFARRYGMTIIGAVQPASFSEPSPREMAMIIDQLRTERVPAIFGSAVFPSKILDNIAAEANIRYVTTLRDDVLPGNPGDPEHSYIGMMRENVITMVTVLGGDPAPLQNILLVSP